jgi:hypothetical protein
MCGVGRLSVLVSCCLSALWPGERVESNSKVKKVDGMEMKCGTMGAFYVFELWKRLEHRRAFTSTPSGPITPELHMTYIDREHPGEPEGDTIPIQVPVCCL